MAQARVLTESGLYKLVLRSNKPEARAFHAPLARQDWVTHVVLPAIRKDGAYVMGEEKGVSFPVKMVQGNVMCGEAYGRVPFPQFNGCGEAS